jgi:hypothetical protein
MHRTLKSSMLSGHLGKNRISSAFLVLASIRPSRQVRLNSCQRATKGLQPLGVGSYPWVPNGTCIDHSSRYESSGRLPGERAFPNFVVFNRMPTIGNFASQSLRTIAENHSEAEGSVSRNVTKTLSASARYLCKSPPWEIRKSPGRLNRHSCQSESG